MTQRRIPDESVGGTNGIGRVVDWDPGTIKVAGSLMGSPSYSGVYTNTARSPAGLFGFWTGSGYPTSTTFSYAPGVIGPGSPALSLIGGSPTATTTFTVSFGFRGLTNDVFDTYVLRSLEASKPVWSFTTSLTTNETFNFFGTRTYVGGVQEAVQGYGTSAYLFPTLTPTVTLYADANPTASLGSFSVQADYFAGSLPLGTQIRSTP